MNDPHGLKRFVDAQNPVYGQVLVELQNGQKEGHWMWFIFPQLAAWDTVKWRLHSESHRDKRLKRIWNTLFLGCD